MLQSGVPVKAVEQMATVDGYYPAFLFSEDESTIAAKPALKPLPIHDGRKKFLVKKYKKMIKTGVSINAVQTLA